MPDLIRLPAMLELVLKLFGQEKDWKPKTYNPGQLGGLDYRFSVSNPFPVQTALTPVPTLPEGVSNLAYYSTAAPAFNYQGYLMWQFWDKESNQLPYMVGTHLGKKKVLNIGGGFASQDHAMEYRE